MKLLLSTLGLTLLLYSCESEYHRQMDIAMQLVKNELKVRQNLEMRFSESSSRSLKAIQNEIRFHAHLSGNESLFDEQLKMYRESLDETHESETLITRYP